MYRITKLILSSVDDENLEVIEEVLQYNTDDIYRVLSECSNKLSSINNKLDDMLQLLQESFLDSVAALLLILVCFEVMKLVRSWMKGVILNGRNR